MIQNKPLLLMVVIFMASLLSAEQPQLGLNQSNVDHLPLIFEPNVGQGPDGAAFVARGVSPIFLQSDRAILLFSRNGSESASHSKTSSPVTLQLMHSNTAAQSAGLNLLPGKSNYYIGADRRNWKTGIAQYSAVTFQAVYPGIDIVYYGKDGLLEYDFVLSPGADPSVIKFRTSGTKSMVLNESGNLVLHLEQGSVELQKPTVYQKRADGTRQQVAGGFVLRGNEVSLRIGEYDKGRELVVDPVLSFSTLIGGNNQTTVSGVAADSSGDMYITGTTFATNYPTVNAFQAVNNGSTNIFVTKLNPAGNVILYSTYIGGSGFDNAAGIAVDSTESAYITGTATSANFPTTSGAFMTTCPSFCNTGFVSKFLSDGSLAFSTYMGGSNSPSHAIAVDSEGEAYIAGLTASNDIPTTPGAFETTYIGELCTSCFNGYVEKLNAAGSALVYSTYFGALPVIGPPSTAGAGIAVDSSGSAYLVGNTTAIPTQNPIQASYVGSSFLPNAFIAKFSPDGSSLVYSTYLGGSSAIFFEEGGDFATSVAVDSSGNAHVTGTSSSCDFPLTINALSTSCPTWLYFQSIFALALNPSGNQLLFSTFLTNGNTPSISVDAKGNSYIAGNTNPSQLPVLNPIESTSLQSNSTTFVSMLNLSGKLEFSTYFGSTYGASSAGIAIDGKGGIYVAGEGQSDFPLLNPIPSQALQNSNYTIFASKIDLNNAPQFSLAPRVSPIFALRNMSSSTLTIDSIVPSSNFTMGGNCGSNLAPGSGCTLILEGADDHKSVGSVTIATNANSKPQTIKLSKSPNGDGSVGPVVTASPVVLQFPYQYIGTTSAAQAITLQNAGTQAATITGIVLGQPFNQTNDCPAVLNPVSSCTISITYTAATSLDYSNLSIGLSEGSPISMYVYGYGSPSSMAVSTPSIQFGNQITGAPSVGRIVNLINTTSIPATAPGVSVSSGFTQTNTCKGVLAPNASCRILVSFVPSGNQNANGTLTANSDGPGGPQTVSLLGTSLAAGSLGLSPVSLSFSGYIGGSQISAVNVTNNSASSVRITGIQTSAPFSETNTCPTWLARAATCQVTVTWDATQLGSSNGTLQVSYTGTGSPQTISLTGEAQAVVQITPNPDNLGTQVINTSSQPLADVWISNFGGSPVTLGNVTIQGSSFSLASNSCGTTLQGFLACGFAVVFKPTSLGLQTATVSMNVNGSPVTGTLQGTGISSGVESVSPASVSFGSQTVGSRSSPVDAKLTNTGTGPLGITSISPSPAFFKQSNNCGTSLAAGASCTIAIVFDPTLEGMLIGTLSVQTDGANSPQIVSLSGTGLAQ